MKSPPLPLLVITAALLAGCQAPVSPSRSPIALHPENPHYFLWRDEPTVLITSAEHYGAVLNLDFDYRKYLDALAAAGMNYTRIFTGAYVEPNTAFNISRNSLAPGPGRFICPWARSDQPGYVNGGNKFDLSRWDDAYFARLQAFVAYAAQRKVVVELTLFCPMYEDPQWSYSPMNPQNNVNGLGNVARTDVYTLDRNGGLLAVQEALTRKLVTELNGADNLFFEICNEPYFGGVTLPWQHRIADVMVETQRTLPAQHLIAQNIANRTATIANPHPAVSIFNFHYATPPESVATNYGLNRVIGDDETGFAGSEDAAYRTEGWDFIIGGGGLYNNLDYSFVAGLEEGTYAIPPTQPGGGGPTLRRQLRILRDFIHGFDFVRMRPDNSIIRGGIPEGCTARALVEPDRAIALYLRNQGAPRQWSARWTGFIEAPASGDYAFHTVSNDGVRLWVDNVQLIDDWNDHAEKEDSGHITLVAGQRYPIRLEYYYSGGSGVMKLAWTPPGGRKESVPANALRLPQSGWGLRGEYFTDVALSQPWATRDDGLVNFSWGSMSPLASRTVTGPTRLELALAPGDWQAEWVDTKTGAVVLRERITGGGVRAVTSPPYETDIALRLRRC